MIPAMRVGRGVKLPKSGIRTKDGLLFHHVGTVALNADQIARLHECGVGYVVGGHFKAEEDDQIRKNWEEYAEEHGLPPHAILILSGSGETKTGDTYEQTQQRRSFCLETKFWPRMCHGLPHRSGNQVKRRILRIFDEAIMDGHATVQFGKKTPIKWAELMKIVRLYKKYEDIHCVAKKMKKPIVLCRNAYDRFIEHNGRVFREHWKALWNVVTQQTGDVEEGPLHSLLRRAIRGQDGEELRRLRGQIDFAKVAIAMTRKTKYCESAWDELVEEFMKECAVEKRKTESKKVAWTAAQKKVFQVMEPVSVDNFSVFLRLLSDCIHEEADYSVNLKERHCDLEKLSELMIKQGITGFHVGGTPITELECLFRKAKTMLWRCEKFVLTRLVFRYTLKERLSLVSMAFDRQIEEAVAEVQNPNSVEGKEQLKQILTRCGHAVLKRAAFIEALVLFTKKIDSEWIPPSKFEKYVTSPEVLDLFPAEKDNSALLKHGEHKKLLEEYKELPIDDPLTAAVSDEEEEEEGEEKEAPS